MSSIPSPSNQPESPRFAAALVRSFFSLDSPLWVVFDADLRLRYVSAQLAGAVAFPLRGHDPLEALFRADAGRTAAMLRHVMASHRPRLGTTVAAPAPDLSWCLDAIPVIDAHTVVGVLVRIEERVETTSRVGLALATRASQSGHDDVLATVAHELRNSLALIITHAELFHESVPLGPRDKPVRHVDAIAKAGKRMLRLLDDLRDRQNIETGRCSMKTVTMPIGEVVEEVIALHLPTAEKKRVAMSTFVGGGLPLVTIDPDRVFQVLCNMMTNAIELTPAGGQVGIAVERQDRELVVSVSDTGPGMTSATKERVFERFYRGSSAYHGSGLGLCIAKQIVEQHGGKIWVETRPAQGTTFTFTLPLDETETAYLRDARWSRVQEAR